MLTFTRTALSSGPGEALPCHIGSCLSLSIELTFKHILECLTGRYLVAVVGLHLVESVRQSDNSLVE